MGHYNFITSAYEKKKGELVRESLCKDRYRYTKKLADYSDVLFGLAFFPSKLSELFPGGQQIAKSTNRISFVFPLLVYSALGSC